MKPLINALRKCRVYAALLFASIGLIAPAHATTFTVDSLDGDITANEINQFVSSINTLVPPTNNWGDNMSTHNTPVEGMRRMYEATGDLAILDRLIVFSDISLAHRNDQPLGQHTVMWTGNIEPVWQNSSSNTVAGSDTGQVAGNIAYCAKLILQTPSIWNNTVPDGNPYGFGVTYKQRAQTYVTMVDQTLTQYITVWFVNTNTYRIQTPSDPRWLPASGGDTAETAWNRQALYNVGYEYEAECHELLGDNPTEVAFYKNIVNAFINWFITTYPNGGAVYYSGNGHNVAKWYYQVPTDNHIENIGHAQHDMMGLYQAWESGFTTLTHAQVQPYADTTQFIINLGATNSWAPNVDGSGTASASLKTDFIFLSEWNQPLYKMIGQANIDDNQLNGSEGCKNTAYILWMKHWLFTQTAADFSISATPASRTVTPGSGASYTATITASNGFNSAVTFSVAGLPAGATGSFSPTSVTGSGSSTLTVTTSSSTPTGSYTLTITGTSGSLVHSTTVSLVVSDFTVSATPSSQTVQAGNNTSYTVNLGNVNGFTGTISLTSSGLPGGAGASFNPSSLTAPGSSTMTVTTSGSTPAANSTLTVTGTSGSLAHSANVTLKVTDFSLSSSPSSQTVTAGNNTTYTITVGALNGFNGTVTFGAVSGLPSGASASFNPTSVTGAGSSTLTITTSATTPAGTSTLTIPATSGGQTHNISVTLVVQTPPPDFSLSASPGSLTVVQGNNGTSTITVNPLNGFSGSVSLSASGLPSGVTASFNPSSTTSTSTLTLTASSTATTGTATISITGTSGSLTHTTTVTLTVNPAADFSLSASPSSLTVVQGNNGTSTVTVNPLNGFNGSVSLSASGLPSGVTASFNPSSTTTSSTLTLSASSTATTGTATVTVTGTSGSLTHNTSISLTVNPAQTFAGIYKLQNEASGLVLNNQGALTNGASITQWTATTVSSNLDWTFIATSNGYYQINSSKSGLDAVVHGAATTNGAGIIQWSFGSSGDDQWKPVANSDGSYTFYNLKSGLVLGDPGSSTNKTTQMDQETANGASNQKWTLISQ